MHLRTLASEKVACDRRLENVKKKENKDAIKKNARTSKMTLANENVIHERQRENASICGARERVRVDKDTWSKSAS
jgi:protein tyrosine/serine phosphatase